MVTHPYTGPGSVVPNGDVTKRDCGAKLVRDFLDSLWAFVLQDRPGLLFFTFGTIHNKMGNRSRPNSILGPNKNRMRRRVEPAAISFQPAA
jgi:hypothetical protein